MYHQDLWKIININENKGNNASWVLKFPTKVLKKGLSELQNVDLHVINQFNLSEKDFYY